jgi:hypothetical protein
LKQARLGNPTELHEFLKKHSPFTVTNEDYTTLLVLRHFKVQFWQEERRVLNGKPEDENFQWGITITKSSENGGTQSNVYIPNNRKYTGLKILNNEVEILTENKNIKSNVTELFRKLKFWGKFTEQDIEIAFNSLCNEQYEEKKHTKPVVKNKILQLSTVDSLTYNEEYEWYEGNYNDAESEISIIVHHTTPKKLQKLLLFVDKQIQFKFYEKMLKEMEAEMIELKNDVWIGEDEDTGEEEPPISVEEFRNRISVNSIIFYSDCSSVIYCNDDGIFFGHAIQIEIDKNVKYIGVNLAG